MQLLFGLFGHRAARIRFTVGVLFCWRRCVRLQFLGHIAQVNIYDFGQLVSMPELSILCLLLFMFCIGIRMADNSRMSKMSSKEDECIFSWKLFTGWDYMIGMRSQLYD